MLAVSSSSSSGESKTNRITHGTEFILSSCLGEDCVLERRVLGEEF